MRAAETTTYPGIPAPHRKLNPRGRGALLVTAPSFSKRTSEEGMGAEAGSSWFRPLVAPGQLHPGEEVAAAGLQQISLGLVGWQGEGTVQGVEPEKSSPTPEGEIPVRRWHLWYVVVSAALGYALSWLVGDEPMDALVTAALAGFVSFLIVEYFRL